MFKVSRRTDYATRVLLTLAAAPTGTILSAAELSARTDVPLAFLHKVVQHLARTGFVRTIAGADGGATLLRPAGSITLLNIFHAIEGPLCVNVCLIRAGACPRDETCPVHPVWARVQGVIRRELAAQTLAGLAAEGQRLQQAMAG